MALNPKIAFIYTGGTVGGRIIGPQKELTKDLDLKVLTNLLRQKLPILRKEKNLIWKKPTTLFSERLTAADWQKIARSVDESISEGASGVVILHGTDTMPYTSAALSYMLQGVKLPIVLTGANYPLMQENTDAVRNICDAIFVAQQKNFKGVFLVFSGDNKEGSHIHLGTRVRKIRYNTGNCFISVNTTPIGKVKIHIITRKRYIQYINKELLDQIEKSNNGKEYSLRDNVCDNVFLFKVHPSFHATQIRDCQGDGIILELYNSGTGCDIGSENYSIVPNIRRQKAPIFVTSQQLGIVDMATYQSSINIREAGATPLKDMITEAAVAKLMWVLAQTKEKKEVMKLMLTNLSGEIS
jgi:L-asparaginase type I